MKSIKSTIRKPLGILVTVSLAALALGNGQAPLHSKAKALNGQSSVQSNASLLKRYNADQQNFTENKGQWADQALFRGQFHGYDEWLTRSGITFDYYRIARKNGKVGREGQIVQMSFLGSNGAVNAVGSEKISHFSKYISSKGGAPVVAWSYGQVLQQGFYPGIDLRSYKDGDKARYDFQVDPNADPTQIRFSFKGANSVSVDKGVLTFGTQVGKYGHGDLVAYQMDGSKKVTVPAAFSLDKNNVVSIQLGAYDHSKQLIIDPVVYGSYYGGDNGPDAVTAAVGDQDGAVYITGWTQASQFPITAGPYFTQIKGVQNGFVARLQGDAYSIDYSVFFGGSNSEFPSFIQSDQFGNIWVAGTTTSPDFPGNTKASSPTNQDIFVLRFEKSATSILDPITNPATLMIGGAGNEVINGFKIAADPNPQSTDPVNLVILGQADQATPEVPGTFGAGDGFLLRYQFSSGTFNQVTSSSFYIGDGIALTMGGLDLDSGGNAFVAGQVNATAVIDTSTTPNSFVTTPGVFAGGRLLQFTDMFLRKYSATGNLLFSACIGGSSDDFIAGNNQDLAGNPYTTGSAVAVDSSGNAYITGITTSFDYPRTRGVYGEIFNSSANVVVTKVSSDGTQIVYSTNLKTQNQVIPAGIAVDGNGQAFVTGVCYTFLPGPIIGTIQTQADGSDPVPDPTYSNVPTSEIQTTEGFLNVLNPTATNLIFGTYLGGTLDDFVYAPYVDSFGDVWVTGWTVGQRVYLNGTTLVDDFGSLPGTLITPTAFKSSIDQNSYPGTLGVFNFGGTLPMFEATDGFIVKLRVGAPVLSSITVTPSTLPGGENQQATVTATLSSPAPTQGAQVTLSLDNPNAASFSSTSSVTSTTVTIPGGATTFTAPVSIYTEAVSSNQTVLVKADYEGTFKIAPLTVVPWLQNLTIQPSQLVGGNNLTATVTLAQPAPTGGIVLGLSSTSNDFAIPASGTVTIPAGQTNYTFTLGTNGVDTKSFPALQASLLGVSKTAQVELDPSAMVSLSLNPPQVTSGGTVTGTVILNGLTGPNFPGIVVTTDGGVNYVVTPASLAFNGTNTATFTIATPIETTQVVRTATATLAGAAGTDYVPQVLSTQFTVDPANIISLTLDNYTTAPGTTVNGTIKLDTPVDSGGLPIVVTSSDPRVKLSSPQTIPQGQKQVTFPIVVSAETFLQNTPVTISAFRGNSPVSATLTVTSSTMTLALSPDSVLGGNSVTGTVSVSDPAPAAGLPVTITINPSSAASLSQNVTIPAGQTSATFTLNTNQVSTTVNATVTANSGPLTSNTANLTVRTAGLSSIVFIPNKARGLQTVTCRITLDGKAPAGGTVIMLSADNNRVIALPISVTIPAGQSTYSFNVLVRRVSRSISSVVTADDGSNTVSTTITVIR